MKSVCFILSVICSVNIDFSAARGDTGVDFRPDVLPVCFTEEHAKALHNVTNEKIDAVRDFLEILREGQNDLRLQNRNLGTGLEPVRATILSIAGNISGEFDKKLEMQEADFIRHLNLNAKYITGAFNTNSDQCTSLAENLRISSNITNILNRFEEHLQGIRAENAIMNKQCFDAVGQLKSKLESELKLQKESFVNQFNVLKNKIDNVETHIGSQFSETYRIVGLINAKVDNGISRLVSLVREKYRQHSSSFNASRNDLDAKISNQLRNLQANVIQTVKNDLTPQFMSLHNRTIGLQQQYNSLEEKTDSLIAASDSAMLRDERHQRMLLEKIRALQEAQERCLNTTCSSNDRQTIRTTSTTPVVTTERDIATERPQWDHTVTTVASNDDHLVIFSNNDQRTGDIKTPNYPLPYPPRLTKSWTIYAPAGHHVRLRFNFFHLEGNLPNCPYDHLTVHDGTSVRASLLQKLCCVGTPPNFYSSGNAIHLALKTDGSQQRKGFHIGWEVVQNLPECPRGLTKFFSKGRISCYKFVRTNQKTWSNARQACRRTVPGSDLVALETAEENEWIKSRLAQLQPRCNYWTAGTDQSREGSFRWISTGQPLIVFDFYRGQPDNFFGSEDCLAFGWSYPRKWKDESCNSRQSYICELMK